jgi:hypothetical protein
MLLKLETYPYTDRTVHQHESFDIKWHREFTGKTRDTYVHLHNIKDVDVNIEMVPQQFYEGREDCEPYFVYHDAWVIWPIWSKTVRRKITNQAKYRYVDLYPVQLDGDMIYMEHEYYLKLVAELELETERG